MRRWICNEMSIDKECLFILYTIPYIKCFVSLVALSFSAHAPKYIVLHFQLSAFCKRWTSFIACLPFKRLQVLVMKIKRVSDLSFIFHSNAGCVVFVVSTPIAGKMLMSCKRPNNLSFTKCCSLSGTYTEQWTKSFLGRFMTNFHSFHHYNSF